MLFDFYRKASIKSEKSKLQPGRSLSAHSGEDYLGLKHAGPTFSKSFMKSVPKCIQKEVYNISNGIVFHPDITVFLFI